MLPALSLKCDLKRVFLCLMVLGTTHLRAQWTLMDPDPEILAYTNFLGQGMSFVDFNLDGWDDLTVANPSGELHFHAGGPDGFTEVDLGIEPTAGRSLSLMWVDLDNDGDRDFIHTSGMAISVFSGPGQASRSEVWIQENGVFVDRTSEWGFDVLDNRHATGMAFHDVEEDGDLDLLVPVYSLPCNEYWMSGNVLLRHDGDTFTDLSVSSGIAEGFQPSFQGVWMHLNDDALIDLLVIHDAGIELDCPVANAAYLNNGDWTFTESGAALDLDESMSSMSATVGDPDADGQEEIFITNQDTEELYDYPLLSAGFFDRNASGDWVERAADVGVDANQWSWSALWVDMDLDGAEELMLATNPFSLSGSGEFVETYDNHLYRRPVENIGANLLFGEDTTDWSGRDLPLHCIVRGDLDGDGDPDGVGLGMGPFAHVWVNGVDVTHPEHHGLTVTVCGTHSNSEAIGTRMVLHDNGQAQQRILRAGEDLFVQHSTTQFFGLGESTMADSLELFWPDGSRDVRFDLVADSAYRCVQSSDEVQITFGEASGDSIELVLQAPPKWTGIQWSGVTSMDLTRTVLVGDSVTANVQWFQGLYDVQVEVDWSALTDPSNGCTNPIADNYAAEAVEDDGTCTYQALCGSGTVWSASAAQCVLADPACPQDVNGDGVVAVSDILELLSFFGLSCADLLAD